MLLLLFLLRGLHSWKQISYKCIHWESLQGYGEKKMYFERAARELRDLTQIAREDTQK